MSLYEVVTVCNLVHYNVGMTDLYRLQESYLLVTVISYDAKNVWLTYPYIVYGFHKASSLQYYARKVLF